MSNILISSGHCFQFEAVVSNTLHHSGGSETQACVLQLLVEGLGLFQISQKLSSIVFQFELFLQTTVQVCIHHQQVSEHSDQFSLCSQEYVTLEIQ
ncbi:MAG: hypothetical protein LBU14_05910, partial [Candidatus Peribacteria bacterium]|nr:hypothetical protein [Candidatus Peribacteria bacterium]